VPTIGRAAADAGRPDPAVVAIVPVHLTSDVAAAREVAERELAFYATIPSYQNVIDREGAASLADLAALGDAEAIARTVQRYRDAGATDIVLSPLDRAAPDPALWELAAL
jgi:hypothetical protein